LPRFLWHVPDVNGSIRFFNCQHLPICYLGLELPIPVYTVHVRCGYLYPEDVWIKSQIHNTQHTCSHSGEGTRMHGHRMATRNAERPGTRSPADQDQDQGHGQGAARGSVARGSGTRYTRRAGLVQAATGRCISLESHSQRPLPTPLRLYVRKLSRRYVRKQGAEGRCHPAAQLLHISSARMRSCFTRPQKQVLPFVSSRIGARVRYSLCG
jgi:hypothetical protein